MKKLLFSLFSLFVLCSLLTAQNSTQNFSTIAVATAPRINQIQGGINFHQLTWTVSGTVSTCDVQLDSSTDGVTWTSGGAITSQACTSNGNSTVVAGTFNYVRINVTTLSGSGATINVVYAGWIVNPSGQSIVLQTNGTNNGSQSKLNIIAGTNITATDNGSGGVTLTASSTAATAFSAITAGTNTTALVMGTNGSLSTSGTGIINANEINGGTEPASAVVLGTNSSKQPVAATTTGSGSTVVLATSPSLTTPNLGTPSAIVLTNATSLPCGALPALTGDTTSSAGSCATTTSKVNGAAIPASALVVGTNSSNQLVSFSPPYVGNAGLGDGLNAIPAGTYLQSTLYNGTGQTITITGIKCFTDNNGTSTMNVSNGSGTGLLTGAVTCTTAFASGTQSATTTIANGDYFKFTFVADGSSKQTTWVIIGTY